MDGLYLAGTLALLAGCLYIAFRVGVRFGNTDTAEVFITGFTVATAWVTLGGYCLSSFRLLAAPWAWLLWTAIGCAAASRLRSGAPHGGAFWGRWARILRGRGYLLAALLLLLWVAATNLFILLAAAPNSFDSMLYHLTRVAYYLQNGTLAPYGANFFAQEELGKNSAVLEVALFAVGGKSDLLQGLPQFIAWFAAGAAVYRLSRSYGVRPSAAAFAGAAEMLLSIAWLEAVTAQNDLLIAAELACGFYFLRRHLAGGKHCFIVLAGVAVGLALGTKASALLVLPALAVAAGPRAWRWKPAAVILLVSLPFFVPACYLDNVRLYGNPLGRNTSDISLYHGRSLADRAASFGRNALRFGFDAFSLDQLPTDPIAAPGIAKAQTAALGWLQGIGVDLWSGNDMRFRFFKDRIHRPDENLSYFGMFGLVCAAGVLAAFTRRKALWLGIGFCTFCLIQCAAGPYDFTRGRFFLSGTAIILPAAAMWIGSFRAFGRRCVLVFVLVSAADVVPASVYRNNHRLIPDGDIPAFWQEDRVRQMTGFHASYPAQRAFAQRVPADARVGVAIQGYEYPLFGPRLGRHLVPVLYRFNANQPLPPDLDWLVFSKASARQPGDISLGAGWYLRRLAPQRN